MEIIIHDNNSLQHYLEEKKVMWQRFVKKYRKSYLIQYGISIFLVIWGFSPLNTSISRIEHTNSITHQSETYYHHNTVNFVGALGIAYIFFVSVSLISLKNQKEGFLREASWRGKKIYKTINESTITIREEGLSYEDPAAKNNFKWIYFSNFSLYKDYLLLNIDRDGTNAFAINKKLLPAETFEDLLNFIRQKFWEKKL